ncbi:MAG TPA: sigma-70 family RNA polymerase sigma factor [Solirubrobacteraceae bacterium]|jgi:RNA polymerase sigma-B factor|nr:sigma-70 family RNA polymerase sigma factor [Solirubrobacteraceae bacterium]
MPARPHRIQPCPGSSPADVSGLIARWQTEADESAREAVFTRFLPMARRLAHRYRSPYEPFEDLMQVAAVGLLGAVDRFDPQRGNSFASYAIPTILGELKKHFRNTGWAVHVSRGQQEMALKIDQAVRQIAARTGSPPGVRELAEYLEVDTEAIVAGMDAATAHYAISLDAPLTSTEPEEPDALIDTLGCYEDGYGLVESKMSLKSAIARLPHYERQALVLRLEGDLKQSEIAAELGCSQMQVSRLLRRAALRLREAAALP